MPDVKERVLAVCEEILEEIRVLKAAVAEIQKRLESREEEDW